MLEFTFGAFMILLFFFDLALLFRNLGGEVDLGGETKTRTRSTLIL
jgi:hypothetical protein